MKKSKLFHKSISANTLCLFLFSFCITNCFSQSYFWAKSAGGTNNDYGYGVSTDANGNTFVTGYFATSSLTFGTTTLTNAGNADIFIVKYDATGNVLWAKSAGGTNKDWGYSVSTDIHGNVFMTGYFFSSSITFDTTTLTNACVNYADIFIVKYDASGNVLWAKSAGGTNSDEGYSVSSDSFGNVYLTGYFVSSSITFGATTLTNAGLTNPDIFIAKYDSSGNVLWAKSSGGTDYDWGKSVSIDAIGNVYLTGHFASSSITFGTTTLTNVDPSTSDIFIVKYDSSGNVLWAKSAGGNYYDFGNCVSTDVNGNVYLTGYFVSSSIIFGTTTLTNANSSLTDNIFIVKFDASGNVLWAKSAGGTINDCSNSCSTDANGNVYLAGFFCSSSITFGAFTLTNSNPGGADIFIVEYDPSGNIFWANSAGGYSDDWGLGISTDANGDVFVTGSFVCSSITFGTTNLTNADNTFNSADIFITKLNGIATSVMQVDNDNPIVVYPNPSNGKIKINLDNSGISQISICNFLGEIIYHSFPNGSQCEIDLSNQAKGIYYLKIYNEEKNYNGKIIIQ